MSSDRGVVLARLAFAIAAWTFVACLVVQVFLVGLDLFEVTGAESGIHREFAYLYGWLAPLMVLLAVGGRLPRRLLMLTVLLLVLFAVQTYLPTLADELPTLAAIHAVNAAAILWVGVTVALAGREQAQRTSNAGGS